MRNFIVLFTILILTFNAKALVEDGLEAELIPEILEACSALESNIEQNDCFLFLMSPEQSQKLINREFSVAELMSIWTASREPVQDLRRFTRPSEFVPEECPGKYCLGQTVYVNYPNASNPTLATIHSYSKDGKYIVDLHEEDGQSGIISGINSEDIYQLEGCGERDLCVGDLAVNIKEKYNEPFVRISGINEKNLFVLEFIDGNLKGRFGSGWESLNLAKTSGCVEDACVNDFKYNVQRDTVVQILAIDENNKLVLHYIDGDVSLEGKRGGKWDPVDMAFVPEDAPFFQGTKYRYYLRYLEDLGI